MTNNSFLLTYNKIASSEEYRNAYKLDLKKTCKFCLRSSDEVSFKNIPHVIPELLGKNNFTSNEECDNCNAMFGGYETDLSNYISPFQTLIGLKTKKKIPNFQGRKDNKNSTLMRNIDGTAHINFGSNLSDFKYDYDQNSVSINFRKRKFIPVNVYRSLVKIGLSLCSPHELSKYSKAIDWLKADYQNLDKFAYDLPLHLFRTRLNNKYYAHPSATLYQKDKNVEIEGSYIPNLCLIVNSGVFTFQLFVPFCDETENIDHQNTNLHQEIYPAFMIGMEIPEQQEKLTINIADIPLIRYDMRWFGQVEEDELVKLTYQRVIRGDDANL